MNKRIAITTGDPNGIGAEIVIKSLNNNAFPPDRFVLVSNKTILKYYGASDDFLAKYEIFEIPFKKESIETGKITATAGEFAYKTITNACELVKRGIAQGIVTAPVAKEAISLTGIDFCGQTEILEKQLAQNGQKAQMLFCSKNLNVLLFTRHLPLKEVSIHLTIEKCVDDITILNKVFKEQFAVQNPRFAMCGLNPHAGENGILGKEEINILIPAVKILRNKGIDITQPVPADALFSKIGENYLQNKPIGYDCIISCYHDQGLIPVKLLAGKKAVNTTIGLSVVRTSPAHGTAFDIAGQNIANSQSMEEAIKFFF